MSKLSTLSMMTTIVALVLVVAATTPAPATAQVCEPLDNGRIADVFYEGTALFFDPVVEYTEIVLTITGPCEDIVRKFGPKDQISFDIREIQRVTDGQYSWQLSRVAPIDPGVQEDLQAARGTGEEDALWWNYFQKGAIPAGPYIDSGSFTVAKGQIIDPSSGEERQKSASVASKGVSAPLAAAGFDATGGAEGGGNTLATKDFVINDDLIVIGSTCIGFDCVNGEVFGFDTLRFKENNTRIQFNDTSGGSFPTTNWQIRANSSANGGESFLGFMDQGATGESESGTRVFAVEANAGSNALFVESGGDAGFGTGNPVLNLHVVDGDSPGLRLEQDGSSGFQPQIWDLAGNETNFFVRDVSSGSLLPFRIFPGSSSSSLVIRNDNVGIGTSSPQSPAHIARPESPGFRLQDTTGTGSSNWTFELNANGLFQISKSGSGGAEVLIRERADGTGGLETMDVDGSIEADNFNISSSRTFKTGFEPVDAKAVLARVVQLPVSEWTFKWDEAGTRHIGPVAEDFLALFGVGNDSTNISLGDAAGVALAAIQGLHQELQVKEAENAELRSRQEILEARLQALEERFDSGAGQD